MEKNNGSGFMVHIPNGNCCIIETSGHCVCLHGVYAENIIVTFPRHTDVIVIKADLYASPEYIQHFNPDYDYGLIIVSGNSNERFGWLAIVPDNKLLGRIVNHLIH